MEEKITRKTRTKIHTKSQDSENKPIRTTIIYDKEHQEILDGLALVLQEMGIKKKKTDNTSAMLRVVLRLLDDFSASLTVHQRHRLHKKMLTIFYEET